MKKHQQAIYNLLNCDDAEADRINDRLQQCNVRVWKDGEAKPSFDIRTRLQLAQALQDDPSIDSVEYEFNNKWTKIA